MDSQATFYIAFGVGQFPSAPFRALSDHHKRKLLRKVVTDVAFIQAGHQLPNESIRHRMEAVQYAVGGVISLTALWSHAHLLADTPRPPPRPRSPTWRRSWSQQNKAYREAQRQIALARARVARAFPQGLPAQDPDVLVSPLAAPAPPPSDDQLSLETQWSEAATDEEPSPLPNPRTLAAIQRMRNANRGRGGEQRDQLLPPGTPTARTGEPQRGAPSTDDSAPQRTGRGRGRLLRLCGSVPVLPSLTPIPPSRPLNALPCRWVPEEPHQELEAPGTNPSVGEPIPSTSGISTAALGPATPRLGPTQERGRTSSPAPLSISIPGETLRSSPQNPPVPLGSNQHTWMQDVYATSPIRCAGEDLEGTPRSPIPVPPAGVLLRPSRTVGRVYDALGDIHSAATWPEWTEARVAQKAWHARLLGCVTSYDNPQQHNVAASQHAPLTVPVWHAYGWAPKWSHLMTPAAELALHETLRNDPRTVAVGPIGIDLTLQRHPVQDQLRLLRALLEAASWNKLPALTFGRGELGPHRGDIVLYDALRSAPAQLICVNTDDLSPQAARGLMDLGPMIYFGVTPEFMHAAAGGQISTQRQILRLIPLERVLICSLAPQQAVGPWEVAPVFDRLASLRNVAPRILEAVLAENFHRFFGKAGANQHHWF